jgi:hypothetical protein
VTVEGAAFLCDPSHPRAMFGSAPAPAAPQHVDVVLRSGIVAATRSP